MTAIEFVFLTPLVFGVIFLTVQFAMYYFATHVAQAAARAGAREARAQAAVDGSNWEGKAHTKATDYIHQLGGSLLTSATISVKKDANDPEQVVVEVTGHVPSILGIDITIDEISKGPIERFVPAGG
ncbi:MAG: pilus assembly protein [Streptomyces sp.]|nr:pilus assembly protein [Streptomyces sp.]